MAALLPTDNIFRADLKASLNGAASLTTEQWAKVLGQRPEVRQMLAGLGSGVAVAGIFNPWDRALYLSVKHERKFLLASNFKNPYQGFLQALFGRTLSGGLYFPLFDMFKAPAVRTLGRPPDHLLVAFVAGNAAGAVNGAILNFLTTIKYHAWSDPSFPNLPRTARAMWQAGGPRPFFKGICATVSRDTVFGGSFALLKYVALEHKTERMRKLGIAGKPSVTPASSLFAAALACVLSSPLNYARNIKYGTHAGQQPPSTMACLRSLMRDSHASGTPLSHLQQQLRLGWGTARVAVGMAVGWELYEVGKRALHLEA